MFQQTDYSFDIMHAHPLRSSVTHVKLSKTQRKHLSTLSHSRKPIVRVGQKGLSENIIQELENALNVHELVKVKITTADRDARHEMIETFQQRCDCECIQKIGHTATLFRRNNKQPVIVLP